MKRRPGPHHLNDASRVISERQHRQLQKRRKHHDSLGVRWAAKQRASLSSDWMHDAQVWTRSHLDVFQHFFRRPLPVVQNTTLDQHFEKVLKKTRDATSAHATAQLREAAQDALSQIPSAPPRAEPPNQAWRLFAERVLSESSDAIEHLDLPQEVLAELRAAADADIDEVHKHSGSDVPSPPSTEGEGPGDETNRLLAEVLSELRRLSQSTEEAARKGDPQARVLADRTIALIGVLIALLSLLATLGILPVAEPKDTTGRQRSKHSEPPSANKSKPAKTR